MAAQMMKPAFSGRSAVASRSKVLRGRVTVSAAARPLWLPGVTVPAHLDGTLAGDFGYDPLNLGKDPQALRWYVQSELIHGRTAMTAVAGILIPGILTKAGILNVPDFWEAGKIAQDNSPIPFGPLLLIEFFLCHFVEVKRWQDFKKPKSQGEPGSFLGFEGALAGSGVNGYPGGPFDPLGLSKGSEAALADYKVKEVKNGRLAMLAFVGFCAQRAATGKGPIDCLVAHVKDPFHTTFLENGVSVPSYLF